ncbi:MAG: GGDEF domain-containing protein [Kiritimatiellia bacterium]|nr:GGDEF domain-containing protein [Kiritimatiellia bacterium]
MPALDTLRAEVRFWKRLAAHDPLTGLLNRRGFEEAWDRMRALMVRQGQGMGLLLIDLDRFKAINDRWGHEAGDRALVQCARRLKAGLRASDLLGRHGGDEFVVALPLGDRESVSKVAERLALAIGDREFRIARHRVRITFTVGTVCLEPGSDEPLRHLLRRADDVLRKKRVARSSP